MKHGYPSNSAIPDGPEYYYTYAGEMPFYSIPGIPTADEQDGDQTEYIVSADRWSDDGVTVEIPVQKYNWESYHSALNQSGGVS